MTILIVCSILIVLALCFFANSNSESNSDTTMTLNNNCPEIGGVNNPGYLIRTATKWQGKLESECRFENFDTMRNGVRAWGINLFNKIKRGTIMNTNQMIDILTPAGSDNPEIARNNYKAQVAKAGSWSSLFYAVFEFEDNPSWRKLTNSEKVNAVRQGLSDAINYCYNGNTPEYFKS